jgi:hypothetical protein
VIGGSIWIIANLNEDMTAIDKMMQMRRWLGVPGGAREPHVSQKRCVDN